MLSRTAPTRAVPWSRETDDEVALVVYLPAPVRRVLKRSHGDLATVPAHELLGTASGQSGARGPAAFDLEELACGAQEIHPPCERSRGVWQGPQHVSTQHHVEGPSRQVRLGRVADGERHV